MMRKSVTNIIAMALLSALPLFMYAQQIAEKPDRKTSMPEKHPVSATYPVNEIPEDYYRLGASDLWVRNSEGVFDILGKFNNTVYGSTYDNSGFHTAVRLNGDCAYWLDDLQYYSPEGFGENGIEVSTRIEEHSGYARVVYSIKNNADSDARVSFGSRADVQLGDNDQAPIQILRDNGTPYGLEMLNSTNPEEAASMQLLFGQRDGVTPADGYWFGNYGLNSDVTQAAGQYACPKYESMPMERYFINVAGTRREEWRYTTSDPGDSWLAADYDDSGWSTGLAPFGNSDNDFAEYTEWDSSELWLRKDFTLDIDRKDLQYLRIKFWNNADGLNDIYINGVLACSNPTYYKNYYDYDISGEALATINPNGTNTIALHSRNTWGRQSVDLGLGLQKDVAHGPVRGLGAVMTILRTGENGGEMWRYTTEQPADGWTSVTFDASGWSEGRSAFGNTYYIGTEWLTRDIWIRKDFTLNISDEERDRLQIYMYHDDACQIYINGVEAFSSADWYGEYQIAEISAEAKAALNTHGKNVITAHCHQDGGDQNIDIGLGIYSQMIPEVDNLYIENGSYDSGMGWCWRDRTVPAGSTKEFSVLFCVGKVPDVRFDPNTGPDMVISDFSITPTEVQARDSVTIVLSMTNQGNQPMPAGFTVNVSGPWAGGCWTYLTRQEIPVGYRLTVSTTEATADDVQMSYVTAYLNPGREFKETNYDNNTSEPLQLNVVAPYTASLMTDKALYDTGQTVSLSGTISGAAKAFATLKLIIRNEEGGEQSFNVVTDENGSFTYPWTTYSSWSGRFMAAAVYPQSYPDDSAFSGCVFDVRGFQLGGLEWNDYGTSDNRKFVVGNDYEAVVTIGNPGHIDLSSLLIEQISDNPDIQVTLTEPENLPAGSKEILGIKISALKATEGDLYKELRLAINADGLRKEISLWYYNINPTGALTADVSDISTTMIMGGHTDISFKVTNTGAAETGAMSLILPQVSWMKAFTPTGMPSLQPGESATIQLRFTPEESMQMNVPQTGNIAINIANGRGLSIPFSVEPVSSSIGWLKVDVCDENTYYTAEAPHLAGASVILTHPVSGKLIAEGVTGRDGIASFDSIPAGWYTVSVTAGNHDSYRNNICIDPSRTTNLTVNLSYQAITIDFSVVETEEVDQYDIVTTMTFETFVPQPVVEMLVDEQPFDAMAPGQSLVYNTVLINHGLIRADCLELTFPDNEFFSFTPLSDIPDSLEANRSAVIPVRVTRLYPGVSAEESMRYRRTGTVPAVPAMRASSNMPCQMDQNVKYQWPCGKDNKSGSYGKVLWHQSCAAESYDFPGFVGGGGGYGGEYSAGTNGNNVASKSFTGCNDCLEDFMKTALICGLGFIPGLGTLVGIATANDAVDIALTLAGACTGGVASAALNAAGCIKGFATMDCLKGGDGNNNGSLPAGRIPARSAGMPDFVKEFQKKALTVIDELEASEAILREIVGDTAVWYNVENQDLMNILRAFPEDRTSVSADYLRSLKPEGVSDEAFDALIERLKGTNPANRINDALIAEKKALIADREAKSQQMGYASTSDMWEAESAKLESKVDKEKSGVCATIKIQLNQTMTFTRQGFLGTLTVYNGNADLPMRNVRLNLSVVSSDGIAATSHEMEMHMETLNGFKGQPDFDSGWELGALETGVATMKFIPTRYAAPEVPVEYTIGGTLTYIDPFTGYEVTRNLLPVRITVRPTPLFELIYFVQRDVMGDDPFTDDIEPSEDAEFAMILLNRGNGTAANVNMVTHQPEIIENKKGLLIDYEMVSSQLNGGEKVLALGDDAVTEFGDVEAHSSAYAQWWMRSSLYGHFTDYSIEATHVTSYGNPDLSLLDTVHVHELVHSVAMHMEDGSEQAVFLVNDQDDDQTMPDIAYFVSGETAPVTGTTKMTIERQYDTDGTMYLELTLPASDNDWVYGRVNDPTGGYGRIESITRESDGADIPLRCCWQTSYEFTDGVQPVPASRLHFADKSGKDGGKYKLRLQPMPSVILSVDDIYQVPDKGQLTKQPIRSLTVRFNKLIDAATFTTDDIRLSREGQYLDLSDVIIIPSNDGLEYRLEFGNITDSTGYYVLNVFTNDIVDAEGFNGLKGKSVSWMQLTDGTSVLSPATDISDDAIYDISGRRVLNADAPGIYIRSGRKFLVR